MVVFIGSFGEIPLMIEMTENLSNVSIASGLAVCLVAVIALAVIFWDLWNE